MSQARLRVPWVALALTAIAFGVDAAGADWALRREAVLTGHVFGLVTGHFAHFNRAHLLGDVLAFAVWAALAEQHGRMRLATTVLVTTVGSSLLVLLLCPEVQEYRGLSVVDCALAAQLVWLGFRRCRRSRDSLGAAFFAVVGAGFAAKTAYEFAAGHAVLAPHLGDGIALLPASHAMGIALGLLTLALPMDTAEAAQGRDWRATQPCSESELPTVTTYVGHTRPATAIDLYVT